jgi:hypothetical protein
MTVTTNTARDKLNDTVLPAVSTALVTAKTKGAELLDSDAAWEARRRGKAVLRAARGDSAVTKPKRRFGLGFGMLAIGTAFGVGLAWVAKRLATPVESYSATTTETTPAPSGTPTDEINLTAGAPTTF